MNVTSHMMQAPRRTRQRARCQLLVLALVAILVTPAGAQPIPSARISGENRQQTSAAIALEALDRADQAVVVEMDGDLPLALAAGMIPNTPVLLVPADTAADPAILQTLDSLQVGEVITFGPGVSDSTLTSLGNSRCIRRLGGPSLVENLTAIADLVPTSSTVYLARSDDLADALAGGILTGGPMVMLEQDRTLSDQMVDLVQRLNPERLVALGGPTAVSDDQLVKAAGDAEIGRLAGDSRYATAAAIAAFQFPASQGGADVVYLSRGDIAPDAAVAGVFTDGPILLIDSCGADGVAPATTAPTAAAIDTLGPASLVALGGTAALCEEAVRLASGLEPTPPPPPPGLTVEDAENLTLPNTACAWIQDIVDLPTPIQMIDGEVPGGDNGYPFVGIERYAPVLRADVDGDGSSDLVVPIFCTGGGSGYTNEVYVYSANRGYIGEIPIGEGVTPSWEHTINEMSIDQGVRITYLSGFDDEPLCCGQRAVIDRWIYQNGQFVLPERRIVDPESHTRDLLVAVNSGDREAAERFVSPEATDYLIQYAPWSMESCFFDFLGDEPGRICSIVDSTGYREDIGWVRTTFITWQGYLLFGE